MFEPLLQSEILWVQKGICLKIISEFFQVRKGHPWYQNFVTQKMVTPKQMRTSPPPAPPSPSPVKKHSPCQNTKLAKCICSSKQQIAPDTNKQNFTTFFLTFHLVEECRRFRKKQHLLISFTHPHTFMTSTSNVDHMLLVFQ